MTEVADSVEANGDIASANYLRNQLDDQIMNCMVDVLKVGKPFKLSNLSLFGVIMFAL